MCDQRLIHVRRRNGWALTAVVTFAVAVVLRVLGNLILAAGLAAIVVRVVSLVVYAQHTGAAQHMSHIKVRIGTWYTRKIGRWT